MEANTENDFWKKAKPNKSGCWIWQGCDLGKGYGGFWYKGKKYRAYRLAYEFAKGPIPKGKLICHSCDNPPCVNPEHLWAGTNKENLGDMKRKGRQAKGRDNGKVKLTIRQVKEIKAAEKKGKCNRALFARRFGVTENAIYSIAIGRTWKHV